MPPPGACGMFRKPLLRALVVLEDGEDVAGRIREPGDPRPDRRARDTPLVLVEPVVPLDRDSALRERIDGGVDVVDREVQHRVVARDQIGLRIDQRVTSTRKVQREKRPVFVGHVDAERASVKRLRLLQVADGEAAERLRVPEHDCSFLENNLETATDAVTHRPSFAGSAITSISTIRPLDTVNPTTANGLPWRATTAPAAPLTVAGRACGAKAAPRAMICRATASAPTTGGRAAGATPPVSRRKTTSGSSTSSRASKSPARAAARNASTISR